MTAYLSGMCGCMSSIRIRRWPATWLRWMCRPFCCIWAFPTISPLRRPLCALWSRASRRVTWWRVAPYAWNCLHRGAGPARIPSRRSSCSLQPAWLRVRVELRANRKVQRSLVGASLVYTIDVIQFISNYNIDFLFIFNFCSRQAEESFRSLVKTHEKYGWVTPALADG